jgi:brefeldin A-inhibited guanine nucleotide-exchange protein 3
MQMQGRKMSVILSLCSTLSKTVSMLSLGKAPPSWDLSSDCDLSISGPGFGIYAVVHLLLPVMSLWLRRSHKDHSYWDVTSANFKHAIGLSCELVVEHIQSFLHSGGCCAGAGHHCPKVLSEY